MLEFDKLLFQSYKCFKNETLIDNIKPINIIIGKNNIGKSSLLDIIEIINNVDLFWKYKQDISITLNKKLTKEDISQICSEGHHGGIFKKYEHDRDNFSLGSDFIGEKIGFELCVKKENTYSQELKYNFYTSYTQNKNFLNSTLEDEENFCKMISEKLIYNTKVVKRIYAERNILPEEDTMSMSTDGYGNRCNKCNK